MRTAIYARYSTELQNEKSIEDQVALCRGYASRQGLDVVGVFEDRARSGASIIGRDGVMKMMLAAKDGGFKVILVEALDRLSRDQADLANMYKRLNFADVEIHTVHGGKVDSMQIGVGGMMNQMYLQDVARKVRRGMAGVIRDGRHAGGRAYGYRPVPGKPGILDIVADEAAVIRDIFASYLDGKTPREIASILNRRRVAPPRGEVRNGSTINGSIARGNGILMNQIYAGRLVWNRLRMVKDPDTGKRVSRLNPPEVWQSVDVPRLRNVEQDVFDRALSIKLKRGGSRPHTYKKAKRLLSGLLKCGCCGSGMSIKDTRKGVIRVQCTSMKESGVCDHRRAYDLGVIETTVLNGLRSALTDPKLIADYVEEYNAERRRLSADLVSRRSGIERRLGKAKREWERVYDSYVKGFAEGDEVKDRLAELRAERKSLESELAGADSPPGVVTLHPTAITRYRERPESGCCLEWSHAGR